MSYPIIIAIGLAVAIVAILQLRNEAKAQNRQVERLFGHMSLAVYCEESLLFDPESRPTLLYPIASTSITCGRKKDKQQEQTDLSIPTEDKTLKTTAAEFFLAPAETNPKCWQLFLQPIEQSTLWVRRANKAAVFCIVDGLSQQPPAEQESYVLSLLPQRFRSSRPEIFVCNNQPRIPLLVGDEILLGNTLLMVCQNGGEEA